MASASAATRAGDCNLSCRKDRSSWKNGLSVMAETRDGRPLNRRMRLRGLREADDDDDDDDDDVWGEGEGEARISTREHVSTQESSNMEMERRLCERNGEPRITAWQREGTTRARTEREVQ